MAIKELNRKLSQAIEVISNEPLLDATGRQVGVRVVATFAPWTNSSTDSAGILWTRASEFRFVQSSSLANILEYQEDHKF